jgi:hypothetical protein
LVTYTSDDTRTPKFTDAQGKALGIRLDSAGNVVPEPGALALALTALLAGLVSRRRRA